MLHAFYLRRYTVLVGLGMGVPSCGARSALDTARTQQYEDAAAQPTASSAVTQSSTAAPTTPTLIVESDVPVVLVPAPCKLSDAAGNDEYEAPPSSAPTLDPSKGECGNGRHEEYESCDDGNREPFDGCDATCQLEPYYVCPTGGEPCIHVSVCGDNYVSLGEECDDGNRRSFDGCSPSCQIEANCSPEDCTPLDSDGFCGDGVVQPHLGETCDHGMANNNGYEGCTELCTLAARCGDGVVHPCGQETCDDGNRVGGDGCSATCRLEQQWVR